MKKCNVSFLGALIGAAIVSNVALADATWTTEWTNADGSQSATEATFYSSSRLDGRVGHYDWNNGRFVGIMMEGGTRFEGKWVQDKSGERCNRSVNGSYYYGTAWFETKGDGEFEGEWSYCDDEPIYPWRGERIAVTFEETWDTDWGPVEVQVDNNYRFIGHYNNRQDGIIVMDPLGNGYYEGYWARTGNDCNCPGTYTTRSGYETRCYGSIKGQLVAEDRFEGSWGSCPGGSYGNDSGRWNGSLRY